MSSVLRPDAAAHNAALAACAKACEEKVRVRGEPTRLPELWGELWG